MARLSMCHTLCKQVPGCVITALILQHWAKAISAALTCQMPVNIVNLARCKQRGALKTLACASATRHSCQRERLSTLMQGLSSDYTSYVCAEQVTQTCLCNKVLMRDATRMLKFYQLRQQWQLHNLQAHSLYAYIRTKQEGQLAGWLIASPCPACTHPTAR